MACSLLCRFLRRRAEFYLFERKYRLSTGIFCPIGRCVFQLDHESVAV